MNSDVNRCELGEPTVATLPRGTRIDRYGDPSGAFASPAGTAFEGRSLPPEALTRLRCGYEVVEPIEGVKSGLTAPYFGQPGLGTQYQFPKPIQFYIESGQLRPYVTDELR